MSTPEERKENRRKWLENLKSGQYPQGKGSLRYQRAGEDQCLYCCLGVAADTLEPNGWTSSVGNHAHKQGVDDRFDCDGSAYGSSSYLNLYWAWEKLGLNRAQQKTLANMNDNDNSFADIAEVIEKWERDGQLS